MVVLCEDAELGKNTLKSRQCQIGPGIRSIRSLSASHIRARQLLFEWLPVWGKLVSTAGCLWLCLLQPLAVSKRVCETGCPPWISNGGEPIEKGGADWREEGADTLPQGGAAAWQGRSDPWA